MIFNKKCTRHNLSSAFLVELRGVEPRSEHETTMLSTCLVAC